MRIAMLTNNYKPFVGGVPISIERLSNSKIAKLALHYYQKVILECYRRGQEYALKIR